MRAFFADLRAVEEVARVELDAGQRRVAHERQPRLVGLRVRRLVQAAVVVVDRAMDVKAEHAGLHLDVRRVAAQHPVVVVAVPHPELVEIIIDVLADAHGLAEIHRRAGDLEDAAVWQRLAVRPRIFVGENLHLLVEHRTARVAVEVEIRMVREVDDRVLVEETLKKQVVF